MGEVRFLSVQLCLSSASCPFRGRSDACCPSYRMRGTGEGQRGEQGRQWWRNRGASLSLFPWSSPISLRTLREPRDLRYLPTTDFSTTQYGPRRCQPLGDHAHPAHPSPPPAPPYHPTAPTTAKSAASYPSPPFSTPPTRLRPSSTAQHGRTHPLEMRRRAGVS